MPEVDGQTIARVLLLNDDETEMEFVVQVLEGVFEKTREQALRLVLEIHHNGSGECGVYPAEQASAIAARVTALADRNGYRLRCVVEAGDSAAVNRSN